MSAKNAAHRAITVIAGLFLGLLLCEGFLRATGNLADFRRGFSIEPDRSSDLSKRLFVHRYEQFLSGHRSLPTMGLELDPDLGWDSPGRVRPKRPLTAAEPPGTYRIVAVGDSFTYGMGVKDEETFPARLQQLIPHGEVLNMGVLGYGIDQAAQKYLLFGKPLHPDCLIFGIYDGDFARVPTDFFVYEKPVFKLGGPDATLVAENTPIPPIADEYAKLRNELLPLPWLALLAQSWWSNFHVNQTARARESEAFFDRWEPYVENVLRKAKQATDQARVGFLIVMIPNGQPTFNNADTFAHPGPDHSRVLAIARRLGITTVDLRDEFPKQLPLNQIGPAFYLRVENFTFGHLSPEGNRVTAKIIYQKLRETGMLPKKVR